MSTMKNGFSTLNRWLGKKNKDKNVASNGKLSKSNHNLSLSISTTNINEPSQLEYNRITPSPAATSNAPFEQTFRVTVLLPKDQLYVSRLGARVPLRKLLELVCEDKLLHADKYEFRNPVDASQVFDLNLSIGAVGLSEIRLCLKTDPYDNFNTDEVIKMRRTAGMRDSCSSSEFSSRQSKNTTAKTISPYSSSNSLNSLESSGVHYARVPITPTSPNVSIAPPKVTAPPRKKRAAPRPPSQVTIHEKEALTNGNAHLQSPTILKEEEPVLNKKNYYVSTPDLALSPISTGLILENNNHDSNNKNGLNTPDQIIDANELYARVEKKNVRNLAKYGGSIQNLSTTLREGLPEPSPRKRIIQVKNKKAPAPPASNRSSACIADEENSILETPPDELEERHFVPQPTAREATIETHIELQGEGNAENDVISKVQIPQPVPRATANNNSSQLMNVSKVLLNRTPTPEPRSLSSESTEGEHISVTHMSDTKEQSNCEDDDAASKQADSGIGEPVPSPLPDSLQSEGSTHETKSTFESSSDEDEMIRVYNFKLGKTVIQPLVEHEMLQTTPTTPTICISPSIIQSTTERTSNVQHEINGDARTVKNLASELTPCPTDTASWNFCIPISPPANFADDKVAKQSMSTEETSDMPITPKIKERPVLNFEAMADVEVNNNTNNKSSKNNDGERFVEKQSNRDSFATTPLDEIVDELAAVIQEKGVNSLIKKHNFSQEIESAKPNTLSNFSIVSIEKSGSTIPSTTTTNTFVEPETGNDDVLRKRSSLSLRINRADSFHTAADMVDSPQLNGLNSRSSSCAALAKLDAAVNNIVTRGKSSSSELSIKESPSLQSLEIIKTILNSRKNSLANNNGSDADTTEHIMDIKPKIEHAKEPPKIYRYSGPPSINLGCWSERPKKAQVSIKNEGDYIFGGKSAQKTNAVLRQSIDFEENKERSNRASTNGFIPKNYMNASNPTSPKVVSSPESPIKRMGIPDKEFRVPITVKPLKDVSVEGTQKNGKNAFISTLPRNKVQQVAAIKRSSSITAIEAAKSQKEKVSVSEVPFGQNTLRKTGLKEKIMACHEDAKENNSSNEENDSFPRNIFAVQLRKQQYNSTTSTPKSSPVKPTFNIKLNNPLQNSMTAQQSQRASTPIMLKSAAIAPQPPPFNPVKTPNNTPPTPIYDPRNQLLDSIRNFKREKLKQSTSQK